MRFHINCEMNVLFVQMIINKVIINPCFAPKIALNVRTADNECVSQTLARNININRLIIDSMAH